MGTGGGRAGWAGRIDRFGWVVVIAAGACAYHNSFDGKLYLDDFRVITELAKEQAAQTYGLLPRPYADRWLGSWTFAAGWTLFGGDLAALHAVNLAVHLLTGAALWALVARTLALPAFGGAYAGRAGLVATAVAGLWVVHPLATEAVTYVSMRYESLMGLFVVAATWAAVRAATAPAGRLWWVVSVVAAYAATASKQSALVLPFVFAVYDRLFLAGSWGVALRRRWPLYAGLVAAQVLVLAPLLARGLNPEVNKGYSAAAPAEQPAERVGSVPVGSTPAAKTLSAQDGFFADDAYFSSAGFGAMTPWRYLRTQAGVILHYVRLAVVPVPLVLDYFWPVATQWFQIWPPGVVVLAALGATAWAVVRGAAGGFLGVWFFGFLALTSSVYPIADVATERRMYVPLMAVVAAGVLLGARGLAWLAARTGRPAGTLRVAAAVLVGCAYAYLTWDRNEDYRDPIRMFRRTLDSAPENARMWNNLGVALADKGQLAEAADAYRRALRFSAPAGAEGGHPALPLIYQKAWGNLIRVLERGPPEELVRALVEFAAEAPDNPNRRLRLARARVEARDPVGAVADYRAAFDLARRQGAELKDAGELLYYAHALQRSGDTPGAMDVCRRAVARDDNLAIAYLLLGQMQAAAGEYTEAEGSLRAAAARDRTAPDGPYQLGLVFLYRGKPAEADSWFAEAIRRDRKNVPAALGRAQALHELGRTDEADRLLAATARIDPNWPQQMTERAWDLATSPDAQVRFAAESLRLARLLTLVTHGTDAAACDVLAAALAESGRFADAAEAAGRGYALARSAGDWKRAAEIEARQKLYAAGKPYRRPAAPR